MGLPEIPSWLKIQIEQKYPKTKSGQGLTPEEVIEIITFIKHAMTEFWTYQCDKQIEESESIRIR